MRKTPRPAKSWIAKGIMRAPGERGRGEEEGREQQQRQRICSSFAYLSGTAVEERNGQPACAKNNAASVKNNYSQ